MLKLMVICILSSTGILTALANVQRSTDCLSNSMDSTVTSLYCRGTRMIRNVIQNLSKTDKPIVLLRGLEIVPSKEFYQNKHNSNKTGMSSNDKTADVEDESIVGRFAEYLRTHELNLKFSDLLAEDSERYSVMAREMQQNGLNMGNAEGRKKDKGHGMLMAMGMMFGKMMAVLGIGGVGALAMKAMGVSMMALMMAAMVGMKSLADKGHENSHSVQYVTADHLHHKRRRRRRSVPIAPNYDPLNLLYKGWMHPTAEHN